jgi:tRNA(Ile)-lysidine synthase
MALVLVLEELRRAELLDVVVAHVHHGLRDADADADADAVQGACAALSLPFVLARVDAAAASATRRRGLEEAAGWVRRDALEALRVAQRCDLVALAHSADDQAETVVLRLLRGAGADGLGAMSASEGHVVRPFLSVRRDDLRALVAAAGLTWRSDSTNWTPASARALVRELIARLEVTLQERIVERLCETSSILREESAWLDTLAMQWLAPRLSAAPAVGPPPETRLTDATSLAEQPRALARRIVRRFVRQARGGGPPPTADALRRILRLLEPSGPARAHVAGLVVRRSGIDLVAGADDSRRSPQSPQALPVPGSVSWGRGTITSSLADAPAATGPGSGTRVLLRTSGIAGPLAVRTRRPGERLPWGKSPRLNELLARAGVAADARDHHPLVCAGDGADTIVWVVGIAADRRLLASSEEQALALTWIPDAAAGRSRD